MGLAQQPNDIIGKELAIEHEQGITVAVFLMEQLLKLSQELGKIGAEALAPVMHTWIGDGQQAHEDVRAAEAVPAGFAGQAQSFLQGLVRAVGQVGQTNSPAGLENIVRG